jgi:hypothetical protein
MPIFLWGFNYSQENGNSNIIPLIIPNHMSSIVKIYAYRYPASVR